MTLLVFRLIFFACFPDPDHVRRPGAEMLLFILTAAGELQRLVDHHVEEMDLL